jgi:hypothetical protein
MSLSVHLLHEGGQASPENQQAAPAKPTGLRLQNPLLTFQFYHFVHHRCWGRNAKHGQYDDW